MKQIAKFFCFLIFISTANAAPTITHNFVYFGRDRERISDPAFLQTAALEGAQLLYAWKELEQDSDVYDFSAVEADLTFLQAHGKKLFIQLQDSTFSAASIAAPQYLLNDPRYHGGIAPMYTNGVVDGWALRVGMMRFASAKRNYSKL